MPTITFSCDSCGQVLRTGADKAGKKAKCVKCGKILVIPAAESVTEPAETRVKPGKPKGPPPLPSEESPRRRARDEEMEEEPAPRKRRRDEEEEEGRPRRRVRDEDDEQEDRPRRRRDEEDEDELDEDRPRGMSKRARWAKVKVGVLLTFISACILIGYGAVMTFAVIFGYIGILSQGQARSMFDVADVLVRIAVALGFILQLPAVVGYVFTVFTPNRNKALTFSIVCICLGVVNLGVKVFGLIALFGSRLGRGGAAGAIAGIPDFGVSGTVAIILLGLLVIFILASEWIFYCLFLRSAALNLKDRYLAGVALVPMFFACGVVALQALFLILEASIRSGGLGRPSPAMGHILMILVIITHGLVTAFAVIYMRAQSRVRAAIDV